MNMGTLEKKNSMSNTDLNVFKNFQKGAVQIFTVPTPTKILLAMKAYGFHMAAKGETMVAMADRNIQAMSILLPPYSSAILPPGMKDAS